MIQQHWLLPLLIAIPFIGGLLSWLSGWIGKRIPRWIALITMMLTFALAIFLWFRSVPHHQDPLIITKPLWLAEFRFSWIPSLGISYHLALDGISLLMIVLTAFIGILAVTCSWSEIQRNVGFFKLNLLWSLGAVIGVFLAVDLFLFFFFWELMLVPVYFLIALWGHDRAGGKSKENAAMKFFIYTQIAGLILLAGILLLVHAYHVQTGHLSFNYMDLLDTRLSAGAELALMLCFFIGFAVKLPIIPFHGWLPDAHAQAPTAGSVDLAGILIKTAAYGLLRFVLPFFPHASAVAAPYIVSLGTIGIFYAALLAFAQSDMKRLLAYTSISHMGFIVVGMYSGTLVSLQGLMIQMIAHGLTSSALFLISGQIYERYHTRDLNVLGGMWGSLRLLPAFMMFFAAALLGMPGTGDFIGEILILFGTFPLWPWLVSLITFSMVLAGLYALILIQRVLFGSSPRQVVMALNAREILMLLALVVLLLWVGLAPQLFLDTSEPAMRWIEKIYTPTLGAWS